MKRCPVSSFFVCLCLSAYSPDSCLPRISYCVKMASQWIKFKRFLYRILLFAALCAHPVKAFCPPACIGAGSVAFSRSAQQKWKWKHFWKWLEARPAVRGRKAMYLPSSFFQTYQVHGDLWEFISVPKGCIFWSLWNGERSGGMK